MIIRGTIPPLHTRAGKDAKELMRTLAPRNTPAIKDSKEQINDTCKMLHLAFKGATTEEIYDLLAFCFIRAARRYDPYYADKTKKVCEEKQFTQADLEGRVGFDCTGILRALVRKGYLASVTGKRKVVGYKLGKHCPAPASFLESGPIRFVYVVQIWFRYYFNEHVLQQMAELEYRDTRAQGKLRADRLLWRSRCGDGTSDCLGPPTYRLHQWTAESHFRHECVMGLSWRARSGTLWIPMKL